MPRFPTKRCVLFEVSSKTQRKLLVRTTCYWSPYIHCIIQYPGSVLQQVFGDLKPITLFGSRQQLASFKLVLRSNSLWKGQVITALMEYEYTSGQVLNGNKLSPIFCLGQKSRSTSPVPASASLNTHNQIHNACAAQSHSLINSFLFTLTTYKECSRSMLAQVLTSTFKSSNLTSILSLYLLSLHESVHIESVIITYLLYMIIVCIIANIYMTSLLLQQR